MPKTSIEWTDVSWPVLNGCRRVSPGCQNCYAERLASTRLRNTEKYRGLAVFTPRGPRWTGESRLWGKELRMPLRLRNPSLIFVCDMGDLFFDGNSDEQIDDVFGVMWACLYLGRDCYPGHIFQVLTKRADRMRTYMLMDRRKQWATAAARHGGGKDPDAIYDQTYYHRGPHPRIWLGVSAEDQQRADERIPHLLETPAAVRFVSAEPLLGPIDMFAFLRGQLRDESLAALGTANMPGIDWLICGGESGPKARPCSTQWVYDMVSECRLAGVKVFVKQLGALPLVFHADGSEHELTLKDRKGSDPEEWPADLRIRELPEVRS